MSLDVGGSSCSSSSSPRQETPIIMSQLARKKRRDISTLKRSRILSTSLDSGMNTTHSCCLEEHEDDTNTKEPTPIVTTSDSSKKTKFLNRYEPSEPMSKEDEIQWRREARKQRNRARYAIIFLVKNTF